jgi:hypothetical protein
MYNSQKGTKTSLDDGMALSAKKSHVTCIPDSGTDCDHVIGTSIANVPVLVPGTIT